MLYRAGCKQIATAKANKARRSVGSTTLSTGSESCCNALTAGCDNGNFHQQKKSAENMRAVRLSKGKIASQNTGSTIIPATSESLPVGQL